MVNVHTDSNCSHVTHVRMLFELVLFVELYHASNSIGLYSDFFSNSYYDLFIYLTGFIPNGIHHSAEFKILLLKLECNKYQYWYMSNITLVYSESKTFAHMMLCNISLV